MLKINIFTQFEKKVFFYGGDLKKMAKYYKKLLIKNKILFQIIVLLFQVFQAVFLLKNAFFVLGLKHIFDLPQQNSIP